MKQKNITDAIKAELNACLPAYHLQAPAEAVYPYAVFELAIKSQGAGRLTAVLEVDVWDSHLTYSRTDAKMDEIEERMERTVICPETREALCVCYNGPRGHVPDPAPDIKRTHEAFDMLIFK